MFNVANNPLQSFIPYYFKQDVTLHPYDLHISLAASSNYINFLYFYFLSLINIFLLETTILYYMTNGKV